MEFSRQGARENGITFTAGNIYLMIMVESYQRDCRIKTIVLRKRHEGEYITWTETIIPEHLIGKLIILLLLLKYPIKFNCGPSGKFVFVQQARKELHPSPRR